LSFTPFELQTIRAPRRAELKGQIRGNVAGTYEESNDAVNGFKIWDRIRPDGDQSFVFANPQGNSHYWNITRSEYRDEIMENNGGGSLCHANGNTAEWYDADWSPDCTGSWSAQLLPS
jgi:hypothetical protein